MSLSLDEWIVLFFLVAIHSQVAVVGSSFITPEKISRLRAKEQPPPWVFGLAWTTCYPLMTTAIFLYWKNALGLPEPGINWSVGIVSYSIFLALNSCWCWIYFGMEKIAWACAVIGIMLAAAITTIVYFFIQSTLVGVIFFPVVLWSSIVMYLNLKAWQQLGSNGPKAWMAVNLAETVDV